ncbi:MAG: hypothetical protein JSW51_00605 [Gemmatimonadota bacterium]|nr:MAG: hypothetical protein JSW51_00605 [Gemmatimonadota bacterium]
MALVRCPKHKIPYNDENPRGCPACAREEEGEQNSLMQELARAQQPPGKRASAAERVGGTAAAKPHPPSGTGARVPTPHPLAVATKPPTPPETVESPVQKLLRAATRRRSSVIGGILIVVMAAIVIFTSGPRFSEGTNPALVPDEDVRPLPLTVDSPIALAFSALGTRSPRENPDDPSLMRYSFGSDLIIDAAGSSIYAVRLRVPNRSIHGLRVGMSRQRAEGELALLAVPQEVTSSTSSPAQIIAGYQVFGSPDARPRVTLAAEVRPPNGCYDVFVDLQPQGIGTVVDGDVSYVAVAREDDPFNWVVTEIRVVSRSRRGPGSSSPAC